MTSEQKMKSINFFKSHNFRSLFDGIYAVLLRQSISWVSFLGSTEFYKQLVYKSNNSDPKNYKLSFKELTAISMMVCLTNTAFVMPLDYIKTQYQRNNAQTKGNLLNFIFSEVKRVGVKGMYIGWNFKLIQYNINSFFSVMILEQLLNRYTKSN